MKKNRQNNNKKGLFVVICSLLFVFLGVTLKLSLNYKINNKRINEMVPKMDIKLDQVSLEEIKSNSKEIRYGNNRLKLFYGNKNVEYDDLEIKGRGNTGWGNEKRSFQIKFSSKVDLLGMGRGKKWVLLPSYTDATSLRNDIAFLLAEMIGEQYINRGKFVEISFNGEYEGLYYLMHKVEIDKQSVDIRSEDGVLFELDDLHGFEEEYYESYLGEKLVLKDMVLKKDEQKERIIKSFLADYNEFEKALEGEDYETVSRIIDVKSFAKYYLVNEFTVNPDAYLSSFYMYKNDDGKINAGPVWDFDYALCNREWIWQEDDDFFSPIEKEKNLHSKMMKYLVKMPDFQKELFDIFEERLEGKKEDFLMEIENTAQRIDDAIKRNNEKWDKGNYRMELKELLDWIEYRYDYFETQYEKEWKYN